MGTFSDLLHGRNAGDVQYWDGSWHKPSSRDYRVTYNWQNLGTGKTGTTTAVFPSRTKFLSEMDNWNRDDRWKFWEG